MGIGIRRRLARLLPQRVRVWQMRRLWNGLSRKNRLGYISHLKGGDWDAREFALVGERFVDRMLERLRDYGPADFGQSTVLEIGCGVGRFLRPLATHFQRVIGVDLSGEMLATAREYMAGVPNVELHQTDGATLRMIPTDSVDYVVSAGVFQHITDFGVIASYIREALRVLRTGGLLLFQFEGSRTSHAGFGQVGARITARELDQALAGSSYAVREISVDGADPIRNVVCVLEAGTKGGDFQSAPIIDRPWITGIYDGVTRTQHIMADRLKQAPQRLTFHD